MYSSPSSRHGIDRRRGRRIDRVARHVASRAKRRSRMRARDDAIASASPRSIAARASTPRDSASQRKRCNCKNSKCLKLYCECFASGKYCDACNCAGCKNNDEHAHERQSAIEQTLERNPNAFRPKIINQTTNGTLDGAGAGDGATTEARHNRGCHCKRSGCLKKYCECFQAAIYCVERCRCAECKNFEGSEAHEEVKRTHGPDARFHDHASAVTSPSPGRRKMLATQQTMSGREGGHALVQASPKRGNQRASMESDSSGGGERGASSRYQKRAPSREAVSVPLMHNLVQQGAVEELARILLCVADETKASTPSDSARVGVAAVAELAANATNERHGNDAKDDDETLDDLMCDEAADEIRGAAKVAASHAAAKAAYADRERALLGELERVVSRLTHNAKARVEHAKKQQRAVKQRVA